MAAYERALLVAVAVFISAAVDAQSRPVVLSIDHYLTDSVTGDSRHEILPVAVFDGEGWTDVVFDWSLVWCPGNRSLGRGAGFCGLLLCWVDLYASSVYARGGYPQGILSQS